MNFSPWCSLRCRSSGAAGPYPLARPAACQVRQLPTLMILPSSHRRVAQRTKLRHLLLLLFRVLVMALPLILSAVYRDRLICRRR